MSTMATEVKATTMEQRMKGLLHQRDWEVQGRSIVSEVEELFHQGTPAEELRRMITTDDRWGLLNERQKAFILAEVDLVGCPVRVGDTIEILTPRPQSAALRRGELQKVARVRTEGVPGVYTEDGWSVWNAYFRLVPSLEFPLPSTVYSTDDVIPESVRLRAQDRLNSFIRHTGDDGAWGICECRFVMGGVDLATPHFVGYGISPLWSRTPDGKRYIGEVLRWMRAIVVQRWIDQQPAVEPTHEPIPERVLSTDDQILENIRGLSAPVGSPNPDPVDITPVEPTMASLATAVDELTRRVDDLGRENQMLRTENADLRRWQSQALRDFEVANEILNEQAVRREWCSEYEEVLERINGRTNVLQWEPRTRDVEVEVRGTVTRHFSVTVTVSVGPDDDAEEMAQEMVENDYTVRSLFNDYYSNDPEIEIDECEVQ